MNKHKIELTRNRHNTSGLTLDDVRLIKLLLGEKDELKEQLKKLSNQKIAEKFNVNRRTIDRIQSGETYSDIIA